MQHKKLSRSNIDKYFKTVTNSEQVGVKKPNPKIFNYAIKIAETKANQSIMIGDNLEADILGAKYIGMDTIYFNIHNDTSNIDIKQINNLIYLKQYL